MPFIKHRIIICTKEASQTLPFQYGGLGPVTLITKSDQIGVNLTKSEIPSTKSGPYCKVTKVPVKDLVSRDRPKVIFPLMAVTESGTVSGQ